MSTDHRQADETSNVAADDDADDEAMSNELTEPLLEQAEDGLPCASRLLLFRSIYFLSGLSGSTWGRFGVIYYNQVKHLSTEQIGILQGLLRLMGFVTSPLWGYVADMIQSRKVVYLFCNTMSMMALLSLSRAQSFLAILLCVITMASFKSSGVLDAHTLDFLGERHRSMYGTIRLMTAISWGLGAVIMGWITDSFGFETNFGLFGLMMTTVLLLTAFGLPARSTKEQERYDRLNSIQNDSHEEDNDAERPRLWTLVSSIFRLPILLWLTEVAVIGAGMSLVDSFLFVFLQDDFQSTTKFCGYTVGVTVVFEIPIFHYSNYLLKEWGHDVLFVIAMVAYVIRAFDYKLLTTSTVQWSWHSKLCMVSRLHACGLHRSIFRQG
jgi:MFS family permease